MNQGSESGKPRRRWRPRTGRRGGELALIAGAWSTLLVLALLRAVIGADEEHRAA